MTTVLLPRNPEDTLRYIRDNGACRTDDPTLYDNDGDYYEPPSGVRCPRCPIIKECLEYALTQREHGVWGNTTDRQRNSLNRPRPRVHCPACQGTDIESVRAGEVCIDCGASWLV